MSLNVFLKETSGLGLGFVLGYVLLEDFKKPKSKVPIPPATDVDLKSTSVVKVPQQGDMGLSKNYPSYPKLRLASGIATKNVVKGPWQWSIGLRINYPGYIQLGLATGFATITGVYMMPWVWATIRDALNGLNFVGAGSIRRIFNLPVEGSQNIDLEYYSRSRRDNLSNAEQNLQNIDDKVGSGSTISSMQDLNELVDIEETLRLKNEEIDEPEVEFGISGGLETFGSQIKQKAVEEDEIIINDKVEEVIKDQNIVIDNQNVVENIQEVDPNQPIVEKREFLILRLENVLSESDNPTIRSFSNNDVLNIINRILNFLRQKRNKNEKPTSRERKIINTLINFIIDLGDLSNTHIEELLKKVREVFPRFKPGLTENQINNNYLFLSGTDTMIGNIAYSGKLAQLAGSYYNSKKKK